MNDWKIREALEDRGFRGLGGGFGSKLVEAVKELWLAYGRADMHNQEMMRINTVIDLIDAVNEAERGPFVTGEVE